jgi:hypothetical protein
MRSFFVRNGRKTNAGIFPHRSLDRSEDGALAVGRAFVRRLSRAGRAGARDASAALLQLPPLLLFGGVVEF